MYPDTPQYASKPKSRKPLYILLIAIAIIGLAVFLLWPRIEVRQHYLTPTTLRTDSQFGRLNGKDLYAYNGMAFYKTDLRTGSQTILHQGIRLPEPSQVHWAGDEGALLVFKQSFSMTIVEDSLRRMGQSPLSATDYTWYLDFKTGAISLVSTQPTVPDSVYYDGADKNLYFVVSSGATNRISRILRFETDAKRTTTSADKLAVIDITNISRCSVGPNLCFIARDADKQQNQKLYKLEGDKSSAIYDSGGRMFATNDPARYIIVPRGQDVTAISGDSGIEQSDYTPEPASLYDANRKQVSTLGFDVAINGPIVHFTDDQNYFVILDQQEQLDKPLAGKPRLYISGSLNGTKGSTKQQPLALMDGKAFSGDFTGTVSYGSGSAALLSGVDGSAYLISERADRPQPARPIELPAARSAVNACLPKADLVESDYQKDARQFVIYLVDDASFAANIRAFSRCMTTSQKDVIANYSFSFAGRDPENGRKTTD